MLLTKRSVLAAVAVSLALASSGCATIMAGGPDKVAVSSNVPATVYVDNQPVGNTPTMVVLDREKSQGMIRIEAPGYQPVVISKTKSINGWFWANLCLGGVVGIVVDLVTGDIKKFDDTAINVALTPVGGAPAPMTVPGAAPLPAPPAPMPAPAPAPGAR